MPLGYMGYMTLDGVYLLTNSTGLNRQVSPLLSQAVWGAGWRTAATTTNYADSQQHFQGNVAFELQAISNVWNLIRDWLVEQRVYPKSVVISPNGILRYDYLVDPSDPRTGCWNSSASFTVDAGSLIQIQAQAIALKRTELQVATNYEATPVGPGVPTGPLNPSPRNLNPIPGWKPQATFTWPNAPGAWSPTNLRGAVLQNMSVNYQQNTQIIRGVTGDANPVAVLQGTMTVDGSVSIWRDGPVTDPYEPPGNFTASGASISLDFGAPGITIAVPHVLLQSDDFNVSGQNQPTMRNFGFAGLGDGTAPPLVIGIAT